MDAITPTYLLAYRFTIAALGMAALSGNRSGECRCRSLNAAHWQDCFYLSVIIFRRMGLNTRPRVKMRLLRRYMW
ncbi:MAG: hypothetical protein ACLR3S_12745 [Clostridium fessum]